jgi:integrase/recombinase XerD
MKKKSDKFIQLLHSFLTVFLPKQRNSSPHTILAAKQVWNMLLNYICNITEKKAETIVFSDISRVVVLGFLDAREKEMGWTSGTRNHRLGIIRSFFRYATSLEPTLSYHLEELKGIPLKKAKNKSFILEYLSQEAMATVLRQPGTSNRMGVRDTFFLSLMYDTAARDCEMLSMQLHDLDPTKKTVQLLGKGNKPRIVPISYDNTIALFQRYAMLYHPTGDGVRPMFYTVRNGEIGSMSDDNVAKFLKKYGDAARRCCPNIPEKIHPHLIRKTRSMHLYQGGMPLEAIALFLGHEDPVVTRVYARADTEMKRRIIEEAQAKGVGVEYLEADKSSIWIGNEDMIKKLCGLGEK